MADIGFFHGLIASSTVVNSELEKIIVELAIVFLYLTVSWSWHVEFKCIAAWGNLFRRRVIF